MTFGAPVRRRLLLGALAALAWLLVWSYVVWQHPSVADDLDRSLGYRFAAYTDRHPAVESAARFVADVTRTIWMVGYVCVAALVLAWKGFRRTAAWIVLVALAAALTTAGVLKPLLGRDRPEYAHMALRDFGFPSGHATGSAVVAGIAVVLAAIFLRRRSQRRLVTAAAVGLALVVGLDRLLLGVHGVTDVLAGYAVSTLWVCGAAYLVDPSPRSPVPVPRPGTVVGNRRLAAILNPVKVEDPVAFRALVEARASELGWAPPVWFETRVDDPGRSMAHEAAVGGADLVLVCGGDGTVRTVCGELAGTGIPVGIVPAGTGNLLARNLDLPLYLAAAIDVALGGQDRAVDIVRIGGDGLGSGPGEEEHFLVMAGLGFDAAIMEGANEQIKAKVGWLAYFVSGARHIMFPAVRVDVSVDDEAFTRHRARTVVVGNVGFLQAGLPLLPDATLDDGRIDVVLINPRRFVHWFLVVARVMRRHPKTDETVMRMTGRKVVIHAAADTPRQIDGDPIGPGREMVCECLPGKLLVRVPGPGAPRR